MTDSNFRRIGILWGLLRWERIGPADDPYLTRLIIGRLRVHKFHRGDRDTFHDHPFEFWTFPLSRRGYHEEVLTCTRFFHPPSGPMNYVYPNHVQGWRWHHRNLSFKHRLLATGLPAWTLVWAGPSIGMWGYWSFDPQIGIVKYTDAGGGWVAS